MLVAVRVAIVAALALAVACCAGCVPSDPGDAPAGLRIDDGTVTVLIQQCPGQRVVGARVYPFATEPVSWSGTGFRGEGPEVKLSDDLWRETVGTYAEDSVISVSVDTSGLRYSAAIASQEERALASGLPSGQYEVDSQIMTEGEYRDYAREHRACPSS